MRNETRLLFNAFVAQIAALNGVDDATKKFTVTPSVQQKLIDKQQESSDFLKRINFVPVTEASGAILGLSVSGTLASRTNTAGGNLRVPRQPSGLDSRQYDTKKTDFDTAIPYALIDMWAKFPDFQARIQNMIVRMQALDRIRVGWTGTSAAAATDRTAHPDLSDVNIGWLQKMRTEIPAQVMTAGGTAGHVYYGAAGDYKTLDALVYDAVQTLLPTWAKDDPNLVVLLGRDLLHDKYFPLINEDEDPMNQLARDVVMSTKRVGNLPAFTVPFFPDGKLMVTRFDNLSIYQQEGANRRTVVDHAAADQVEDFQSSNDAYVIEDTDYALLVENISRKDA
ncbi:phage major capsid protein, P2 family [Asticcacaulis solisilvae]|uniref:phage major capsid protein, P2 family n=1 Tax=Asticcacaulis solisilvae TaxID=1217274 RepID=UPI003FD83D0B